VKSTNVISVHRVTRIIVYLKRTHIYCSHILLYTHNTRILITYYIIYTSNLWGRENIINRYALYRRVVYIIYWVYIYIYVCVLCIYILVYRLRLQVMMHSTVFICIHVPIICINSLHTIIIRITVARYVEFEWQPDVQTVGIIVLYCTRPSTYIVRAWLL